MADVLEAGLTTPIKQAIPQPRPETSPSSSSTAMLGFGRVRHAKVRDDPYGVSSQLDRANCLEDAEVLAAQAALQTTPTPGDCHAPAQPAGA